MRWWRFRFPVAALAALCLALVVVAPGEGATGVRPKAAWQHAESADCTTPFRLSPTLRPMCIRVAPGEEMTVFATVTATQDVVKPRIVLNSANGDNVITVLPLVSPLPAVLTAGDQIGVSITVKSTGALRAKTLSARLYLADKQSLLTAPLNIRVVILHPTPEELARTPVVVPTNHIQLVKRPPLVVQLGHSARFNIRHLVVSSGTNVTWTNRAPIIDESDTARAVKGTLCDPTSPFSATQQCDFDPATFGECNLTVDENLGQVITDADGRILCFLSPKLRVQGHYSLRLTRPTTRQPLTYYMEDALHAADAMVEQIGTRTFYPYVTVK
jgi:hypothetical protein